MYRLFYIFLVLFILSNLTACEEEVKEGKRKKKVGLVQSAPYELLIVCDKAWYGSGDGEPFRNFANTLMLGMPQDESVFKVLCINHTGFNKIYSTFGCIIFVNIGKNYTKEEVLIARDQYARPQVCVTFNAPDNQGINHLIETQGQRVLDIMTDNEMSRSISLLKKDYSGIVDKNARKMFGCSWHVPSQINLIKTGEDFFWASSPDNTFNACMYSYPWVSNDTFTKRYFCHKRDSAMYFNIEGEEFGQHMETDSSTVSVRDRMINGQYVFEVRGLWDMKNDAMGGPFVSYVQLDSVNQRIIITEGFVYLPNKQKKKQVHQLEASLRTLKFLKPPSASKQQPTSTK
jgi:hypothetical protein